MVIPEYKLSDIRGHLDSETVSHIVQYIGYEIYRGNKFKLRDEKSPSASIRRDGFIKDFGGDFSGDLIDLLREYHNMSFEEAVQYIATCVGVKL